MHESNKQMDNSQRIARTLREAHDEDEVDGDEPEQVGRHHSVYHDHEGTGRLEASVKERLSSAVE